VLELRPNCECCNKDLPPEAHDARICSFECTFCRDYAETTLHGRCPNCGGEFVPRPIRRAEKLARFPASTVWVFKPEGAPERQPRNSESRRTLASCARQPYR
jgi:uncharacterized protein